MNSKGNSWRCNGSLSLSPYALSPLVYKALHAPTISQTRSLRWGPEKRACPCSSPALKILTNLWCFLVHRSIWYSSGMIWWDLYRVRSSIFNPLFATIESSTIFILHHIIFTHFCHQEKSHSPPHFESNSSQSVLSLSISIFAPIIWHDSFKKISRTLFSLIFSIIWSWTLQQTLSHRKLGIYVNSIHTLTNGNKCIKPRCQKVFICKAHFLRASFFFSCPFCISWYKTLYTIERKWKMNKSWAWEALLEVFLPSLGSRAGNKGCFVLGQRCKSSTKWIETWKMIHLTGEG